MAGENDILISALISAGVEINHKDYAELRRKLDAIGEALGEGALDSLKTVASELRRMESGLTSSVGLLNDAAKRGLNAEGVTQAEMRALTQAFNKAKTYQDQLRDLVNQLNRLGKTEIGGEYDESGKKVKGGITTPLFNELAALNAKFAQLGATLSAVSPLVDRVTQERKAFQQAEARRKQKERQDEQAQLRRQTMATDTALRDESQKRGRRAFYAGAKDDYQGLDRVDVLAARRFAQAEFRSRSQFKDLAIKQFGLDDTRTIKAIQSAGQVAQALDKLDEAVLAQKLAKPTEDKAERDARRIAKLERDQAYDRDLRARTQAAGRMALHEAGGVFGSVEGFKSADKAGKALKYLNDELRDQQTYLKALTEAYGEADPRVQNVAKSMQRAGSYVGQLRDKVDALQAAEAKQRKDDAKAEQERKATKRKADSDAERSSKEAARRAIKQIEAERALEVSTLQDQGIGRRVLRTTRRAADVALLDQPQAERALKYAAEELKYRTQIERLTRDAYGADSDEARQAERRVNQLAEQYARLTNRVNELKAASRETAETDKRMGKLQVARTDLQARRDQRGETNALGRATLLAAGGLDADISKFSNLRTTKAALDYLEKELADINRERKELTSAYGAGSAPEQLAIQRAQRYAEVIGQLKAQIDTLTDAKARQNRMDTAAERIAAVQRKRATARTLSPTAFSLLDGAITDPKSLKNAKDAKAAYRAGTAELGRLQQIQDAVAKSAGELSDEYRDATAEVDKLASALAEVVRQQQMLEQVEAGDVSRRSLNRLNAKSNIYNDDGRKLYAELRHQEGGLESLTGERRDAARSYTRERLNETRRQYQLLARQFGQHSSQAAAAAAAVQEYERNLRRLGGTGQEAAGKLAYLTNVVKMFFKYAIMYQGLYQLLAGVTALARGVADLQAELLEIQAVTGSSSQEMEQLGVSVTQVAENSKFSLMELTKAAKTLAQAGIPIAEINSALSATANFAAATGTNLETAADLVSTTRDVFKELTDDVIANQLAKAINVSKLTGEDLKTILSLGAQTARDFGLSSEQFLGAVATLRNAGLKASTVATGLRQGMLELFGPDNMLVKALQSRYRELGENLGAEFVRSRFFAFTKSSNPLIAALSELKRLGFADEGQSALTRAFDVRSANAIKAMVANLDEIAENEAKITFGRAAAEGAATVVDGLNASFTRLYSTITSFTYDQSKGFVGWLTTVVQKLDLAIQKQNEWNTLRDAQAGLTEEQRKNSNFRPEMPAEDGWFSRWMNRMAEEQRQVEASRKQARDDIFGVDPDDVAKDAATRASASAAVVSRRQLRADEFERAAQAFDVEAAAAGETAGQLATKLYESRNQLRDLQAGMKRLFGVDQPTSELKEMVRGYTDLTPSQRDVRRAGVREQLKGTPISAMSDVDFDRSMSELRQQISSVDGAFRGYIQGWNEKLVKANEVVIALGDRPATNPQDVEALVYQSVLSREDAFLDLIRNSTAEATDANFEIMLSGSQAMADALRAKGREAPFDTMAAQYAEAFVNRIARIASTTVSSKAGADINLAVSELAAKFDGLDKATISRLQDIQSYIARAAAAAEGGAYRGMLESAVARLQGELDKRGQSVIEKTAERARFGTEAVGPGIREPLFNKYLSQFPSSTPGVEQVRAAMADPNLDIGREFAQNTELSRTLEKYFVEYRDAYKLTLEEQEKLIAEESARLALEAKATRAAQDYNAANSSKEFANSLDALSRKTAAEKAVAQKELDDALAEQDNFSNTDPTKNREIASRIARAKARVNEIDELDARERARIERERTKYNLAREKTTAERDRTEALNVLKNADGNTPTQVIEDAKVKFNAATDSLLDILNRRLDADGDLNELTEAQIEAEKQKLRHFEDMADSLDLAHRREATLRDKINDQLEALVQTTGSRLEDARARELGLEPGTRAQRRDFYSKRADLLGGQMLLAGEANARDAARYQANAALIERGEGTSETLEEQRKIEAAVRQRNADMRAWGDELGDLTLKAQNAGATIHSALQQAFDLDTIRMGLEQSGSSVEGLAVRIHEQLIEGIEGIGDAFADALLEGEDFFESLDKLFIDTGKAILRDVIKSYTTETIGGFLKSLSPAGRAEGGTSATGNGLIGTAVSLGKSVFDWATGTKSSATPRTPGLQYSSDPNDPTPLALESAFTIGRKLVGGGSGLDDERPEGGVLMSAIGGGAGGKDGCCCGDGLLAAAKGAGNPLEKVLGSGDAMAEVADKEGEGFFASLSSGFMGLLDNLKGGFGDVIGGLGKLLGFGSGGGGGAFGLLASVMGFKNGGIIKAATGGIITGKGTGTSDSIPGFIRSKSGKLRPLLTSNGESILNAKATSLLGADAIHALNSGHFGKVDVSSINSEISRLMRSAPTPARAPVESRSVRESRTTQVAVTPAQMRMRMGDWLEQHVLEELSKR